MKDKYIIILIIIICITLVFINKINTKSPILYPTIYIIGLKRDYISFEDYVKSLISKLSKHNIPYDLHLDNVISDSFFLNKTMKSHFIFIHDLEYVKISEETEKKIKPSSKIFTKRYLKKIQKRFDCKTQKTKTQQTKTQKTKTQKKRNTNKNRTRSNRTK